ncbi:Uncharacterized protein TCM_023819 [Theobroma cacao]|uniref:Uncharacterized protein n=1 Tax=Theobroma cacao TaxID=3641 RepID=A0A061EVA9_THECC|nr:Uncharacterized protein TCM_023819 [Theobroma cacao]
MDQTMLIRALGCPYTLEPLIMKCGMLSQKDHIFPPHLALSLVRDCLNQDLNVLKLKSKRSKQILKPSTPFIVH